ncbi:MAG: hypothetical protein ABJE95_31480 [Byssovorax sp.]
MSNRHLARRVGCGLVALALTLTGAPVFALDPPSQPQEAAAKASFDAGQRLYDQRKFADALILFRTAKETSGSPNARLMIARCLLELDALAEAHDELQATMHDAAALAPGSPKYARTRDTAATELAALERRVGRLAIVATGLGAGAVVTLNGAVVPPSRLGAPFAVDPGDEIVELTRPGVATQRRVVTVRAGEIKTITLDSPSVVSAPSSPVRVAPPPPPPTGGGVRVAGFFVAGVGVAGAVVLAVAEPIAQSKFSTLQHACGDARCVDPKYAAVVDSGRSMEILADVGLAVGVAGLLGGGLMIALGGPSPARARVTVSVSPTTAQLRYELTF